MKKNYIIIAVIALVIIVAGGGLLLSSKNKTAKNEASTPAISTKTVNPSTSSFKLGDSYQGGKIAYIFVNGDPGYIAGQTHGLIAAASDQGSSTAWYNGTYVSTGATGLSLGTGSENTSAIISNQGNTGTYAAKVCRDYRGGGYSDWYLPSKDELNKLYINRDAIGGFSKNFYWSSSEANNKYAWGLYFLKGDQFNHDKNGATYSHVRAVRVF